MSTGSEGEGRHGVPDRHSPIWVGGYLAPFLVVTFTLAWSLAIYLLIGSRARDWEFGTVPYVPAESAFTSLQAPPGPTPKQVVLPIRLRGADRAK